METPRRSLLAAGPLACTLAAAIALLLAHPASALWPTDPSVNLAIAERAGSETEPIPAPTSDGGCYVGWFDPTGGSYAVYLQRLDRLGVEQWPHNGILISDHAQDSALYGWDLTVDGEDNAILVFSDLRAGGDLDIYAYKVGPAGDLLWGADGVTLSWTAGDEMGPTVTTTDDGDAVFTWSWFPVSGDGAIYMQRLGPTGVARYVQGGLRIAGDPGESPAFSCPAPSLGGSVIVSWVRDIDSYASPRHLHAQRFAPDGTPVWPAVVHVYDLTALPMGFRPTIQPDGSGGVLSTWNAAETSLHTVRLQHVDAQGHELFGHNGVKPTTDATRNHIAPTLSYHPDTGDSFVFWDERNTAQSNWGLWGQRLSITGTRQWGDEGRVHIPLNTMYKTMYRSVPCDDGAMVLWLEELYGPYTGDVVRAMRVDAAGAPVWAEPMKVIASQLSDKGRLSVISTRDEMAIATWEDPRGGSADIYAQNLNADGTIGVDPAAAGDGDAAGLAAAGRARVRLSNTPSPFAGQTLIRLVAPERIPGGDLIIADATGRQVRRLALGSLGTGERSAVWDGRDDAGRQAPGGLYYYSLAGSVSHGARGATVLLR